jgi:hypothetical protein
MTNEHHATGSPREGSHPSPEASCGVRHVLVTHDGKPIGHTEPLDPDNPMRWMVRRNVKYQTAIYAAQKQARRNGQSRAIRAARAHKGRRMQEAD